MPLCLRCVTRAGVTYPTRSELTQLLLVIYTLIFAMTLKFLTFYIFVWFVSGLPIPIVVVSVGIRYDDYGKGDV